MADKTGYEPILDVEKGEEGVTEDQYAELRLTENQTELLWNLDSAIEHAKLHFVLPKVDRSQLVLEGTSFIQALVCPTVTALFTFFAALFLEEQSKLDSTAGNISLILVQYYPCISATVLFISSVSPIQARLLATVKPVFTKMASAKHEVDKAVAKIGPDIDKTIMAIKGMVDAEIKHIEPILINAKKHEAVLLKMDPTLEIPNPERIEKEFRDAHGLVQGKVREAQKYLNVDNYIPDIIKSAHAYYWRVIFPVLLIVLAIQLVMVFATQYFLVSIPVTRAVSSSDAFSASPLQLDAQQDVISEIDVNGLVTDVNEDCDIVKKDAVKDHDGVMETSEEDATKAKEDVKEDAPAYEEEFHEFIDSADKDVEKDKEDFFAAVGDSKALVMNVVMSYLLTILQLIVIFLLSTSRGMVELTNKALETITEGTLRTLRQYGVSIVVLGTKVFTRVFQLWKESVRFISTVFIVASRVYRCSCDPNGPS